MIIITEMIKNTYFYFILNHFALRVNPNFIIKWILIFLNYCIWILLKTVYLQFVKVSLAIVRWKTKEYKYLIGFTTSGEGHFGAVISAPPIRRWTRAVSAPDIWAPFLILFFELWRKNNEAGNSLNAVEREPVRAQRRTGWARRIEDSSWNRFALNGIQGLACFIVFSS